MRLLWIAPYGPWEPWHGGKLRLFNLLRQALLQGNTVELWVFANDGEWPDPSTAPHRVRHFPLRARIGWRNKVSALLSGLPEAAWMLQGDAIAAAIGALTRESFDLVVLEQAHCAPFLPALQDAGIPVLLSAQNVEHLLLRQMARKMPGAMARWRVHEDARRYRRLEKVCVDAASYTVAASDADAALLVQLAPRGRIGVVPNGVDVQAFAWRDHRVNRANKVLFTGTLGYLPNTDAIRWMVTEILPAIRALARDVTLHLVGAGVTDEVRDLARAEGVVLVGPVTEIRRWYDECDLFLVPLRTGSGTRLKLLEALATGIPTVATPAAVEGIGAVAGRDLLVESETTRLVTAVLHLLSDEELRTGLSVAGRRLVERRYEWAVVGRSLSDAFARARDGRAAGISEPG